MVRDLSGCVEMKSIDARMNHFAPTAALKNTNSTSHVMGTKTSGSTQKTTDNTVYNGHPVMFTDSRLFMLEDIIMMNKKVGNVVEQDNVLGE
jgi:hypothetical protein